MAHDTTPHGMQAPCQLHGIRHYDWSHTDASCKHQLRTLQWQHSREGIRELAGEARKDGDAHYARHLATGSATRHQWAMEAYAKAAAWEGTGDNVAVAPVRAANLVARMGPGAQRLRLVSLHRKNIGR